MRTAERHLLKILDRAQSHRPSPGRGALRAKIFGRVAVAESVCARIHAESRHVRAGTRKKKRRGKRMLGFMVKLTAAICDAPIRTHFDAVRSTSMHEQPGGYMADACGAASRDYCLACSRREGWTRLLGITALKRRTHDAAVTAWLQWSTSTAPMSTRIPAASISNGSLLPTSGSPSALAYTMRGREARSDNALPGSPAPKQCCPRR